MPHNRLLDQNTMSGEDDAGNAVSGTGSDDDPSAPQPSAGASAVGSGLSVQQRAATSGSSSGTSGPGASTSTSGSGVSASGQPIDPAVYKMLQDLGLPGSSKDSAAPDWAIQIAEDELDASNAQGGDYFGAPFGGFKFPAKIDVADVSRAEDWAHKFAAASNFKYMPTAQMIFDMANNQNISSMEDAWKYWYGKLGTQSQQASPWLQYGVDKKAYKDRSEGIKDAIENLTGSRDTTLDNSVMSALMQPGVTSGHVDTALRDYYSQHGYAYVSKKYGYDYKTWQSYRRDHKAAVEGRYGVGVSDDASFLADLDTPLGQQQARGAEAQQQKSNLSDYSSAFAK